MPLRLRKFIYLALALAGCIVWVPISILAIPAMGLGLFGLITLWALLRGIFVLPVVRRVRSYYSIPIGMGTFTMGSFMAIGLQLREEVDLPVYAFVTGTVLFLVGAAVLIEMYFFPYESEEDRAEEPARPSDGIRS
ncbi:MAG TPA: hypothetical protein VIU34_34435 [Steroidobacter sp.]